MIRFAVSFFLISIFALGAMAQQGPSPYPDNWQLIEADEFNIYHPKSWRKSMDGEAGSNLILVCPDVLDYNPFRENITLYIQDLSQMEIELDLNAYAEISKGQLYSMIEDLAILSSSNKKDKFGRTFHELIYTGKKEQYELKWLHYYWVIDKKAYVLGYTGDIKDYDKFYPTALKIMQSFEILD